MNDVLLLTIFSTSDLTVNWLLLIPASVFEMAEFARRGGFENVFYPPMVASPPSTDLSLVSIAETSFPSSLNVSLTFSNTIPFA